MADRSQGSRPARALHMQPYNAVTEATENDIAAITRDGRPHAGVEQLLDLIDDLAVLGKDLLLVRS